MTRREKTEREIGQRLRWSIDYAAAKAFDAPNRQIARRQLRILKAHVATLEAHVLARLDVRATSPREGA